MTTPHTVRIGPATLYLGDAYAIRPTLGFFDADVMDPPYEFNNSGGGAWRKARGASDQIVSEGLTEGFDRFIINPMLCGAVMVFCHNDQLPRLLPYLDGSFHRFALCVWTKPNPAPHRNKNYLPDLEPYLHAWNRGFHPVGEHHDMHRHVSAKSSPSKFYDHPTVKPDDVMVKIMANVNGRTICDPFMGTGSTGVAAIRLGKRFTGIEHNPKHFATAVKRITVAVDRRYPNWRNLAA
ncbi:DNA methyltransferase [Novosphingobium sp.]|uniref:DNA methyltransferase n=1 Tax=Novosphingobium sp. TaxID=1874826 RepID=UPI0026017306|nr:DNA methyltransferase [Novosphingobium sp.]